MADRASSSSLRRMLAAHPQLLRATAGWTAVAFLPTVLTGRFVAFAVDAVISQSGSATLWLVALAVVGLAGTLAERRQVSASAGLTEAVRRDLTVRLVTGSLSAPIDHGPGGGAAEVTSHVEMVREFLSMTLRFLPRLLAAAGAVLGIATLSVMLAALVAPFVVVGLWAYGRNVRRAVRITEELVLATEDVNAGLSTAFEGVRDVVAYNAEGAVVRDVGAHLQHRHDLGVAQADTLAIGRTWLQVFLGYGPLVAVLAATPWLLRQGLLTVGGAVGAVTYLQSSLAELSGVANWATMMMVNLFTHLDRLDELAAPGDLRPSSDALRQRPTSGEVILREVSFAWSDHAEPIVDRLDLTIGPGDHLAVVGPSGIGKSTLASLVAGVMAPTSGSITIGGVPVMSLADPDRRAVLAVVPQEAYVFTGSLRENFTYLAPDATDDEILVSVEKVGAQRILERLGGLDGRVDPAISGISEGERQLIALTRVHLSPARVVVLDEGTGYLDPLAEEQAEQAFVERRGSLVVIAHRMSSSLRAKRVLVMDGASVSVGTHQELVATNALYADLHGHWAADVLPA